MISSVISLLTNGFGLPFNEWLFKAVPFMLLEMAVEMILLNIDWKKKNGDEKND